MMNSILKNLFKFIATKCYRSEMKKLLSGNGVHDRVLSGMEKLEIVTGGQVTSSDIGAYADTLREKSGIHLHREILAGRDTGWDVVRLDSELTNYLYDHLELLDATYNSAMRTEIDRAGYYIFGVWDNGGTSVDRYTMIDTGGDMFGFSGEPFYSAGFNQYCGKYYNEVNETMDDRPIREEVFSHLGEEVQLKDLPEDVQKAILQRLEDDN